MSTSIVDHRAADKVARAAFVNSFFSTTHSLTPNESFIIGPNRTDPLYYKR